MQQITAPSNPYSSFSLSFYLLCIRRLDPRWLRSGPRSPFLCYSLQQVCSFSWRMKCELRFVHIKVNRS
jgi:hypothetical protein